MDRFREQVLQSQMRDPNVGVRCFVVAGSIAFLPIQNIQVQLLFGWVLGSAGFPAIEQGKAFFGISYDEKRDLERELAPERNNKLRRSLIKGWCR
jgi:hypothetical protein